MPRDLLTEEDFRTKLERHQQLLAEAKQRHGEAVLRAETEDRGEAASAEAEKEVRNAHATIRQLEDRIEGLMHARTISAAKEQQQAEEDRAATRREDAAEARQLEAEVVAAARKAEQSLKVLNRDLGEVDRKYGAWASKMRYLTSGGPREEQVALAVGHRFEGQIVVGRLRRARVVSDLDLIDDFDATARQFGGASIIGMMLERVGRVLMLARMEVPELREEPPADEADEEAEAERQDA